MKITFLVLICALHSFVYAYSPPREGGIFLEAALGAGDFLYDLGDSKPKLSNFTEMETGIHGITSSESDSGIRYGGGFGLNLVTINQISCGTTTCPDDLAKWEKNQSIVLSPFLRFEGLSVGFVVGARLTKLPLPLPNFAIRLGQVNQIYLTFEILNGQSILSEGLLKFGLGGKVKNTELWMGGDLFPYQGLGLGARVARIFGPIRIVFGGRIGRGDARYVDKFGGDPSINVEIFEYAGTIGFDFRIPN